MRLIYAHQHAVPAERPEELQLLQTADGIAQAGHSVTIVSPAASGQALRAESLLGREPNVELVSLQHAGRWFRSKRPFHGKLLQYIKGARPDAVYLRNYRLAEWLIAQHLGCPVFFEAHELRAQAFVEEQDRMTWRARRALTQIERRERFVCSQASGIICITRSLLDDIGAHYGARFPAVVAPDGVDLALAAHASSKHASPEPRSLLFLGTLHAWKGVEVLLHAMLQLPAARLDIAGGPPERVVELQGLATELGVAGRVRFLGFVHPKQRFELIARYEICLLPSTPTSIGSRYTSPLKLFEYMAMGRAIVAGDFPALREVLRDGESALLASGTDPEAFARAIARLQGDAPLRQRLGVKARDLANHYSWSARGATIAAFIENSVQERSRAPFAMAALAERR